MLPLPLTFITPSLAIVKALPLKVPPDQLNWLLIVTGSERLTVPALKMMVSFDAGTPIGVQLVALNQSELIEPFQVRLVRAEARFSATRQGKPSDPPPIQRLVFIKVMPITFPQVGGPFPSFIL